MELLRFHVALPADPAAAEDLTLGRPVGAVDEGVNEFCHDKDASLLSQEGWTQ